MLRKVHNTAGSLSDGEHGPTVAVLGVEVLVDGVQRVLLLAAVLSGSEDVAHALMQEGVLTLKHTHTHGEFTAVVIRRKATSMFCCVRCTSVWTMCWRCRRRSNTQPYRSTVPLESSCWRTRSNAMNVPVRPTPALPHKQQVPR